MDEFTDDYFHYNQKFPPTFFQPPEMQQSECENVTKEAILQYLRSSYSGGAVSLKHHNALLPSGLTAGEAAMLWLQDREAGSSSSSQSQLSRFLANAVKMHFQIDPEYFPNENFHLSLGIVNDSQLETKVQSALKAFLRAINHRAKGYTFTLKTIVNEVREARMRREL